MNFKKPELYIKRKFDDFLVRWKDNPRHLPLIVKGARQVGKTECIRHFAEGRYESFVEINFVERPQILADYRADIRKYCEGLDPVRIQNVFDDVPFQLAKVLKCEA